MSKPDSTTPETRARLGGLAVVAGRGPVHMVELGERGQVGLDARLDRDAGLSPDMPDYVVRHQALKRAHFIRLAEARWGRGQSRKGARP